MNKKRIINLGLIALLILIVVVYIVKPFQSSDLELWRKQVSEDDYLKAIELLEGTLDNPRKT